MAPARGTTGAPLSVPRVDMTNCKLQLSRGLRTLSVTGTLSRLESLSTLRLLGVPGTPLVLVGARHSASRVHRSNRNHAAVCPHFKADPKAGDRPCPPGMPPYAHMDVSHPTVGDGHKRDTSVFVEITGGGRSRYPMNLATSGHVGPHAYQ